MDHNKGALTGIRVLEFTFGIAGPWIGRFLAYCGAEVIRVESPQRRDIARQYIPPWAPEMGIQSQLCPWLTDWNAGKRFISVDLTNPTAIDLIKRLATRCDVVIENYATGVVNKLGIGYAQLAAVRPDLVMLSTTGFGGSGPYRKYITWGPNIEGLSGLSTASGFPERECTMTQYAYPDVVSALHGTFAIMCALDYRARTGQGQHIDLSQYEATVGVIGDIMMQYLANGQVPERLGNRALSAAPHGCYRCHGDDRWCVITVFTEVEWEQFCRAVGKPEWQADPRFATRTGRLQHTAELDQLIEEWTSTRTDYEVMVQLQAAGIAAAVVQTVEDKFLRDRQLAARQFFEEVEHLKKGKVIATGIPLGLTGTPGRSGRSGAGIGEDNDYVFGEILGMTTQEIQEYIAAGAIEPVVA